MKHRSHFSARERSARSLATKLIHDKAFVVGSLVEMKRTCGKTNCKCTKGDKHTSWYLSIRHQGKRKMICIPRQIEKDVFDWIRTYKEITKHMDTISQASLERMALSVDKGR